jgi:hypothetical protein
MSGSHSGAEQHTISAEALPATVEGVSTSTMDIAELRQTNAMALDVLNAVFQELRNAPVADQPHRSVPLFFPNGIDLIDLQVKISTDKDILTFEVKIEGPKK